MKRRDYEVFKTLLPEELYSIPSHLYQHNEFVQNSLSIEATKRIKH